jgi:8-oxo-dGTP pyrophosphatase MutT (NUDIX family)
MHDTVEKLCPILIRPGIDGAELLVFRHPLAGVQLVKGTREPGESIAAGALRELAEESGITQARATIYLGGSANIAPGQLWHFLRVETGMLASRWSFATADDGGHLFSFFWWPLAARPGDDWHPIFVRALGHVRGALA